MMDILPYIMKDATNVTDKDIYNFYSNRSLIKFPRSLYTLNSDLQEQLNLSYNNAKSSLTLVNTYNNIIFNIISSIKHHQLTKFIKYIEKCLYSDTTKKIREAYDRLSNIDSTAAKHLYRARYDNCIFGFIADHQHMLPDVLTNTILKYIPSISYCSKNLAVDSYMKKCAAMNFIGAIFPDTILEYYNLYRFNYLNSLIHNGSLSPIYYDKHTGWLYFDVLYNKRCLKEQIIEEVHSNRNGFGKISIDEVYTLIHYRSKEFSIVNSDSTIAKYKTKYSSIQSKRNNNHIYIDDTFSTYDCCNVTRKVINAMIGIRNYKRNLPSMFDILGRIIKLHPMAIDYSRTSNTSTSDDFTYMIPIHNDQGKDEVAVTTYDLYSNYSRKDIKITSFINRYSRLLHNTYNTLIGIG